MKKICLLVIVSIMAAMLSACGGETEKEENRNNLEFTVVSEDRLPDELKEILDQKKESAFKLTYADEGYLYICVGYGKQESGGYSVTVNELYETDNAIYVNTNLLGPKAGSSPGTSPSYPYIVNRIQGQNGSI